MLSMGKKNKKEVIMLFLYRKNLDTEENRVII